MSGTKPELVVVSVNKGGNEYVKSLLKDVCGLWFLGGTFVLSILN